MEKKKPRVFVIGILALVLLAGAASAQENTTVMTEDTAAGFNLKVWFQKTFNTGPFSVVGDTRRCARYPGVTLTNIPHNGIIPKGSTYYPNSLINVFDKNWNPLGEWKSDPSVTIICSATSGCIAEYYDCPYPECASDSNCVSWYGGGSKCETFPADDPNIIYKSGSTFKACMAPDQQEVTCWYYPGTTSTCMKRTYVGDTTCPATYMGMTLYSSKSVCEASIPGVGGGDIRIDGKVSVSMYILQTLTKIKVPLKNFGTETETINLEGGFYSPYYAKNVAKLYSIFPFFSSVSIPNVNPAEKFVSTKQVTLTPGQKETVELSVDAYNSLVTYNVGAYDLRTGGPIWFVGLYKEPLGGYINEAGTTGRGVMFDYGDYKMLCPFSFFGSSDILCDGLKVGTCGTFTNSNIFNINTKCPLPSTVAVVNGSVDPYQKATLSDAKKITLTKDTISKSTSADLLASSCLSSSECILPAGEEEDFSARCTSIAKLREEGILTEADTENFFGNAKKIGTGAAIGAGAGIAMCMAGGLAITAATGGAAAPITIPLVVGCGGAGALIGGSATSIVLDITADDALLKELDAENANAVGICVKESKSSLENFTGWAAFFNITGDRGVDGLLIILGMLIILVLLFRKQ